MNEVVGTGPLVGWCFYETGKTPRQVSLDGGLSHLTWFLCEEQQASGEIHWPVVDVLSMDMNQEQDLF